MIDGLAVAQSLLAFLDGRQELLFIGDVGAQRLVDEPGLAAPGRVGQAFEPVIERGVDAGSNGDGF